MAMIILIHFLVFFAILCNEQIFVVVVFMNWGGGCFTLKTIIKENPHTHL